VFEDGGARLRNITGAKRDDGITGSGGGTDGRNTGIHGGCMMGAMMTVRAETVHQNFGSHA
jgi:hypothetical protein